MVTSEVITNRQETGAGVVASVTNVRATTRHDCSPRGVVDSHSVSACLVIFESQITNASGREAGNSKG